MTTYSEGKLLRLTLAHLNFTWRERVNVESANVVTVDPNADAVQLSAIGMNLITAYQLLNHGPIKKGD